MSVRGAYDGSVISPEAIALIERTKTIAAELRVTAQDNKKLSAIKGNEELVHRIDEVLVEVEEQSEKLVLVCEVPAIQRDIQFLQAAMLEIQEYFDAVNKASMFTSKHKLRLRMQNLYQSLRARCTQLMTAVSLELLTAKPMEEKVPKMSAEIYKIGLYHFFGVAGKSKNFTLAFEKFTEAAEYGEIDSMIMLAKCYLEGHGIEVSLAMASHWLERAALAGAPHAKTELAMLILSRLKEQNANVVKEYFDEPLAGNRQSMRREGSTYLDDDDKSVAMSEQEDEHKDLQYAIKLLLEAAHDGHAEAKTALGSLFEEGQDLPQAAKWYSLASNGGCARATFLLAEILFHSPQTAGNASKAFSLYSIAAQNGHDAAHYGLGMCFEIGLGIESSLTYAIHHYTLAANAGSAPAMYNLGYVLVKSGIEARDAVSSLSDKVDTETDIVYANMVAKMQTCLGDGVRWLRCAMERKVADAAFQLGRLYEQGIGVPEDPHSALQSYLFGADQGHIKAAFYAANMLYEKGEYAKAGYYYKIACQQGTGEAELPEAFNSYALLLEDGRLYTSGSLQLQQNATQDLLAAAAYYFEAVMLKHPPAYYNLILLLYNYNIQSFLDLREQIVYTQELLQELYEVPKGYDDDKHSKYSALLSSLQQQQHVLQPQQQLDSRSQGGQPPIYHTHSPAFPSRSSQHRLLGSPESKQEAPDMLSAPYPQRHSGAAIQDLWQVSVLQPQKEPESSLNHSHHVNSSSRRVNFSPSEHHPASSAAGPGRTGSSLVRSGEVYVTSTPIVPPHYVPKAQIQSIPLSAMDKKPPTKSNSSGHMQHRVDASPSRAVESSSQAIGRPSSLPHSTSMHSPQPQLQYQQQYQQQQRSQSQSQHKSSRLSMDFPAAAAAAAAAPAARSSSFSLPHQQRQPPIQTPTQHQAPTQQQTPAQPAMQSQSASYSSLVSNSKANLQATASADPYASRALPTTPKPRPSSIDLSVSTMGTKQQPQGQPQAQPQAQAVPPKAKDNMWNKMYKSRAKETPQAAPLPASPITSAFSPAPTPTIQPPAPSAPSSSMHGPAGIAASRPRSLSASSVHSQQSQDTAPSMQLPGPAPSQEPMQQQPVQGIAEGEQRKSTGFKLWGRLSTKKASSSNTVDSMASADPSAAPAVGDNSGSQPQQAQANAAALPEAKKSSSMWSKLVRSKPKETLPVDANTLTSHDSVGDMRLSEQDPFAAAAPTLH